MSGTGGSSPLGGGGAGITDSAGNKSQAGVAGTGYGAGGGGAYTSQSSITQLAKAGGNGSPGIVIVDVYYL
jgi:hypothetical protein